MIKPLVGVGFFFIVWIILFFHKNEFRREMLIMSLIVAPLGPISEIFYLRDYWHPDYALPLFGFGIEDILFAFFIGGIANVAYEEFFVEKMRKTGKDKNLEAGLLCAFGLFLLLVLTFVFDINSIYSSSVVFLMVGFLILRERHDLIQNAVFSGFIVAFVMLFFYSVYLMFYPSVIEDWWKMGNISGVLIIGAPIEEIIWGFCWGFLSGPFYEFWRGLRQK